MSAHSGYCDRVSGSELNTLEWDILNPDWLKQGVNKRYLILRLRKSVDLALIPLSINQKFPALITYGKTEKYIK